VAHWAMRQASVAFFPLSVRLHPSQASCSTIPPPLPGQASCLVRAKHLRSGPDLHEKNSFGDGKKRIEEKPSVLVLQEDQLPAVRLADLRPRQLPCAMHRTFHVPGQPHRGMPRCNESALSIHKRPQSQAAPKACMAYPKRSTLTRLPSSLSTMRPDEQQTNNGGMCQQEAPIQVQTVLWPYRESSCEKECK
jgi:hypothetical protein